MKPESGFFTDLPVLEAPTVRLRPVQVGDVEAYHAYAQDPALFEQIFWEPHRHLLDSWQVVQHMLQRYARNEPTEWAVCLRESDRMIGTCGLVRHQPEHRLAEIGFVLGRAWQGRGLMQEAVLALFQPAFEHLALRRLEARTLPDNAAACRLLERLGFTCEGRLRQSINLKGRQRDLLVYSLLAEEWAARPSA